MVPDALLPVGNVLGRCPNRSPSRNTSSGMHRNAALAVTVRGDFPVGTLPIPALAFPARSLAAPGETLMNDFIIEWDDK